MSGSARGKLDGWRYTTTGYQITTIDGIKYKTLFDLGDFGRNFKAGAIVEFEIPNQQSHSGDPYPSLPYARILRVVNGK